MIKNLTANMVSSRAALAFGLLVGAAAVVGVSPAEADANEKYPERPVTIVVPFPPGGATDIIARVVADGLSNKFGTQFIVENRGGAGGTIGTAHVAEADADGYTLLMATLATNAIAPSIYPSLRYDPAKDFDAISMTSDIPSAVIINPEIPAKNLAEFIEYAKGNPGKLSFGSPGVGVSGHLATELFARRAGIDLQHIPYQGSAPALTGLLAGEVALVFDPVATTKPLAEDGRVTVLAISGTTRSELLPDVPTLEEAGLPGVASYTWNGFVAPAGTPQAIIAKLDSAINEIMDSESYRERMVALGSNQTRMTPAEFTDFIRAETARWGEIAAEIDLQVNQ